MPGRARSWPPAPLRLGTALALGLLASPATGQGTAPAAPALLKCAGMGTSSLALDWAPAIPAADAYHVLYGPAGAGLPQHSITTANTSLKLYDLPAGGAFVVRVRAHAGDQGLGADAEWGPFAPDAHCATKAVAAGAPGPMRRVGTLSQTEISVAWTSPRPADNNTTVGQHGVESPLGTVASQRPGGSGRSSAACVLRGRLAVPGKPFPGGGPWQMSSPGEGNASLKGLHAGTEYELQVSCGAMQTDAVPFRTAAAGRRYTTMYRITENGITGTVDFLSSHNSADANGSAAFLTFAFAHSDTLGPTGLNSSTITQYCVEQDVGHGWADYVSCAMGGDDQPGGKQTCSCASTIDRQIQHKDMCAGPFACDAAACDMQWQAIWQSGGSPGTALSSLSPATRHEHQLRREARQRRVDFRHLLRSHVGLTAATAHALRVEEADDAAEAADDDDAAVAAGGGHPTRRLQHHHHWGEMCNCSAAAASYSATHAGRAATPYPPGSGYWYSTPAQGECAEGAEIGAAGCTFRRVGAQAIAFGANLTATGFVRPTGQPVMGQNLVPESVIDANSAVFKRVFAGLTPRCCGC
jgi:hypothetical protein